VVVIVVALDAQLEANRSRENRGAAWCGGTVDAMSVCELSIPTRMGATMWQCRGTLSIT
jgi:hypothetical protein